LSGPWRKEVVVARGDLDRLARSVVRLAQRSMVLSLVEGEAPPNAARNSAMPGISYSHAAGPSPAPVHSVAGW
jgi:hypothetical protein